MVEMARSMLKEKQLLNEFYAEAVATLVYLLNRSITKVIRDMTPYEAWYERKLEVSGLKVLDV